MKPSKRFLNIIRNFISKMLIISPSPYECGIYKTLTFEHASLLSLRFNVRI